MEATKQHNPLTLMKNSNGHVPLLRFAAWFRIREAFWPAGLEAPAPMVQRAAGALRRSWQTNRLPQFHHGLIETARTPPGQKQIERFLDPAAKFGLRKAAMECQQPRH